MLKNDGYKNGGIIYEKNGSYFRSADGDSNSWVNPENGYCYRVGKVGSGDAVYNSIFFWYISRHIESICFCVSSLVLMTIL